MTIALSVGCSSQPRSSSTQDAIEQSDAANADAPPAIALVAGLDAATEGDVVSQTSLTRSGEIVYVTVASPFDTDSDAGSDADASSQMDAASSTPASTDAGSAAPVALSMSVSPLELHPSFAPNVHDYYVRCSAGANPVTITLSGAAEASLTLVLIEDQATVVEADGASYWIRCLPHDFPEIVASPHPEAGTPSEGWYLIGNFPVQTGVPSFAMVVDVRGTPVWYRRTSGSAAINVDVLAQNTITYIPYAAQGTAGAFESYQLEPWQSGAVHSVGIPIDVHELRPLPGGGFMLLAIPLTSGVDLTGLGSYGPDSTIIDCAIQQVDSSGNLVWQWVASDHIDPVRETTAPAGTSTVDTFHCNSIDLDDAGNVLVSARHLDAVFYIDKTSGRIVWKLGGTAYNKDGAQILRIADDPRTAFYRQHDARFRPGGKLSLFDDHGTDTGPARGVEYTLDLVNGVAKMDWQYEGPVNSSAMGSFRRYADGTSLIGWGSISGGLHLVFTEVDAQGRDLLDLEFAGGDHSYRAVKVPLAALDVNAMRRTSGLP